MIPTRTRALQAAVELVGTAGLRALTHAKVDEHAALPKGSTSNSFRSRAALLSGVSDWIVQQEMQMIRSTLEPATVDELIDVLCDLIDFTCGPNRTLTTARLVLFMEASHNVALRKQISQARALMEASIIEALSRLGAREPQIAATAVMACAEGIILHRIARHEAAPARPILQLVVRAAFS